MSEEELSNRMILIINGYKECLDYNCNQTEERQREIKYDIETLETMIDLYNKEKEKNKELEQELAKREWVKIKDNGEVEPLFYISKDKIREYLNKMEKRCDKPKFSVMKKEIEELLEERN